MAYKMKYTNGRKADPSSFPFKIDGGVAGESPNKFLNFGDFDFSGAGKGAAAGAGAGAMIGGPWGAVIGGLAGGIMSIGKKNMTEGEFNAENERKKEEDRREARKAKTDQDRENYEHTRSGIERGRNRRAKKEIINREPRAPREETRNEEITR